MNLIDTIKLFVFLLFAFVAFVAFNGNTHLFDWDEINFAEAAREMIVTGDYATVRIDYLPFWEKPPLFIWMQAMSMKMFGINEFAARFPNALAGFFTLITVFFIGKKHYDISIAFKWMVLFTISLLPLFYFKSGIIDPWFNYFIFTGSYFVYLASQTRRISHIIAGGILLGLAVMTKGPVALLLAGLTYAMYEVFNKFNSFLSLKLIITGIICVFSVGGIWFLHEWLNGRWYVIEEFILYQIRLLQTEDAGHGGPWYYHIVVLLLGVFPSSALMIEYFYRNGSWKKFHLQVFMFCLFAVTLVVFSIVKTKIIHYSSLCYFPVTFFGALGWNKIEQTGKASIFFKLIFGLTGFLFALAFLLVSQIEKIKNWIFQNIEIKDPFALANFKQNIEWGGYEWLPGLLMFLVMVVLFVKTGWKTRFKVMFPLIFAAFWSAIVMITPRVEKYSQGPAIAMYEMIGNQYPGVVVYPYGFKSYAHLFYSRKKPGMGNDWQEEMQKGHKVFVVTKVIHEEEFQNKFPSMKPVMRKGGFILWTNV